MIGEASIASPIADGMVSKKANRIPLARMLRNSSIFPTAALFETSGRVTVPMATPKIPSGNCIKRKAMFSQLTGPLPRLAANPLLIRTFTCTAGGDDRRSHQDENGTDALVAPLKIRAILV